MLLNYVEKVRALGVLSLGTMLLSAKLTLLRQLVEKSAAMRDRGLERE
jgi:hypothetical protein